MFVIQQFIMGNMFNKNKIKTLSFRRENGRKKIKEHGKNWFDFFFQ